MEAQGKLQHRTNSEPSTGRYGGVSVLTNTTPGIRIPDGAGRRTWYGRDIVAPPRKQAVNREDERRPVVMESLLTWDANPVETAGAAGHCSVLTQEISTSPRKG